MSIKITLCPPDKFKEVAEFVKTSDRLVHHLPHFYKIILENFGDTAFIATDEKGKICGWTFGIVSQKDPSNFFLWQISVHPDLKRKGIGLALLKKLMDSALEKKCKKIRATVELDNIESCSLFENAGFENVSSSIKNHKNDGQKPYIFDFYGEDESMICYERPL